MLIMKILERSMLPFVKLFMLSVLLTVPAVQARTGASYYGIVKDVVGIVLVTGDGRTIEAKEGMRLFDHNEIMVTVGSQVSFMDRYDHIFHLQGPGHVMTHNQIVEVRRGHLWFQSLRKSRDSFALTSASAQLVYSGGEGIFSFDEVTGRTQFLALNDHFYFGSRLNEHYAERVGPGEFSFLDPEEELGRPRVPRPIGQSSFNRMTGLFQGVTPMTRHLSFPEMVSDESAPVVATSPAPATRLPASLEVEAPQPSASGQIRHLRAGREIRRELNELYFQSSNPARSISSVPEKPTAQRAHSVGAQEVPVHVFGAAPSRPSPAPKREVKWVKPKSQAPSNRTPASVPTARGNDPFEQALEGKYRQQTRHPSEVNALIQQLRSVERDFQESY